MTSALETYINRTVAVITSDGRMIVVRNQDQKKEVPFLESHVVSGRSKLGFKLDLTLKLSQLPCLLNQENNYGPGWCSSAD
ncbi:LSM8 homolog, U6 small nuclear RNA associated isoform X2 [Sturnira hondurensis]|uniref:LSM8 homolog, U6 small nuclear RNA associated isoform X2 n=1 Tax=Sturnira hondurensis TaxID=192404 RepID=UPI00187AE3E4|nr:LSM8 homolog, U6 small nuclear RNA associated isoform X2 [Sturnira hondurensis]